LKGRKIRFQTQGFHVYKDEGLKSQIDGLFEEQDAEEIVTFATT